MADTLALSRLSAADIRARRAADPKPRARDFAESLGLPEAALVAAHLGHGVTAIDPMPGRLFPLIGTLGERNRGDIQFLPFAQPQQDIKRPREGGEMKSIIWRLKQEHSTVS